MTIMSKENPPVMVNEDICDDLKLSTEGDFSPELSKLMIATPEKREKFDFSTTASGLMKTFDNYSQSSIKVKMAEDTRL